jgi:hypothetical protein
MGKIGRRNLINGAGPRGACRPACLTGQICLRFPSFCRSNPFPRCKLGKCKPICRNGLTLAGGIPPLLLLLLLTNATALQVSARLTWRRPDSARRETAGKRPGNGVETRRPVVPPGHPRRPWRWRPVDLERFGGPSAGCSSRCRPVGRSSRSNLQDAALTCDSVLSIYSVNRWQRFMPGANGKRWRNGR